MDNSNDKESVELIQIDIVENSKDEHPPKTAKDLFSVFKVSDESDYEPDENNGSDTDSDEPLSKRMKVKTKKQVVTGLKTKEPEAADRSLKKKVFIVVFILMLNCTLYFQKYYSQKYKKEWEAIPSVKPWISESIYGPHYFYCRFCKKDYKCGKTEIFKHMSAMKHRKHLTTTASGVQVSKNFMKLKG